MESSNCCQYKKNIYIGQFDTAIEGAIAYNNYITENNLEHTINPLPEECQ